MEELKANWEPKARNRHCQKAGGPVLTKLYKVLNDDGSAIYGTGQWFLPNGRPGKWMPKITCLEPCVSGYHIIENTDALLDWLGPAIWIVEARGKRIEKGPGIGVYQQARLIERIESWNAKLARLFAADCAERVLHIYEKKYPDDKRPRETIESARQFAEGKIDGKQLAAASAAAWAAARAAAWDVASAAAWAAARATAKAAARAAAWDVARDVARDAERKWQANRLREILGCS